MDDKNVNGGSIFALTDKKIKATNEVVSVVKSNTTNRKKTSGSDNIKPVSLVEKKDHSYAAIEKYSNNNGRKQGVSEFERLAEINHFQDRFRRDKKEALCHNEAERDVLRSMKSICKRTYKDELIVKYTADFKTTIFVNNRQPTQSEKRYRSI